MRNCQQLEYPHHFPVLVTGGCLCPEHGESEKLMRLSVPGEPYSVGRLGVLDVALAKMREARVSPDVEHLSSEELEQLKALGYTQ